MAAADDFYRVIEQYHQALDEFSRGNPDPVKEFYSTRDDVAIANPFFPLTRGREQVVERLERSVQNFRDGEVGFQNVVKWVSGELACIVELEEWRTKVGGRGRHAFHFAGYDPLSGRRWRLEGGASPRRSHNHRSASRVGDTGVDLPPWSELPKTPLGRSSQNSSSTQSAE